MGRPYILRCLDAKYDEENDFLVLLCFFEDFGEQRIIVINRKDCHWKYVGNEVPHIEMHRTAQIWRGKRWKFVMEDDPKRERVSEENQMRYLSMFNKRIEEELQKTTEGLKKEEGQIQRKLGRMATEGKLDVSKLLREEQVIQAKLSDISGL